jgi:IclR family acetate operon transcriptional repressor
MRSLERAIDVLEVLEDSRHALRLSDIARRADLPVATTQRILNVLEARGRIERDATGYRPGVGLLFGAHAYLATSPLVNAARPALQDLAAETGLTASLVKRIRWHRVVLARVDGARPLRYELPIGERLPLHLGAGKVLVATMDPTDVDRLLGQLKDRTRANGTVIDRDDFLNELKHIRDVGYSYAFGEREPGMASVAATLTGSDTLATAAVQVAGPQDEIPAERVEQLGIEVQRAALAITRRIV